MFFATTSFGFPVWQSKLQQCVFIISILAILHSAFWLTYLTLEIHELTQLREKTDSLDSLDAQLFNEMALFGNIFAVFIVSVLLLYGNLVQKPKLYWVYLIINCLILLPLGPTFTFIPFPSEVISTQALIFILSTLFQFFSLIIIWTAARESMVKGDLEENAIIEGDQLKCQNSIEKDVSTLKF